MKHAVLLLWHKDTEQLKELLGFFDTDFTFYIHADKKCGLSHMELLSIQEAHPNVRIWSRYKVYWGGIGILEAELFLLGRIVEDGGYDYVHFMSGQDFPIKPLEDIKGHFKDYRGWEFVEYMPLPDARWEKGTWRRFELFRLNDYMDYHSPKGYRRINRFNEWQLRLGVKRRIPDQFPRLYGGSNWMSVTFACASYIISNRNRHRKFFRRLRFTFAPDEVYFHTVILNSSFAGKVTGNNLRLIFWDNRSGSPLTLTEKHWWEVATSDRFFVRKLDREKSAGLLEHLHTHILQKERLTISPNGYWEHGGLGGHVFDNGLAQGLLELLPFMEVRSVGDFGCGPGWYVALLRRRGYDIQGYDGNPTVEAVSRLFFDDGFYCQQADLSEEQETDEPFDMVLSLEVGEHIPANKEAVFLNNLANNAARYVLLSWAVEGQQGDGHVNCRSNEYITERMRERGFTFNEPASRYLRKCATKWWFKNTVMLFERR